MLRNLVWISCLLLAGCGGSEERPIGPFSATLTNIPAMVEENTQTPIVVSVHNVKSSANISFTSSSAMVTVVPSENSFTLQATEVDRDMTVTITMSAIDGTDIARQVTRTFTVEVNNTSFAKDLAEIEVLVAQRERFIFATEENNLLNALREMALLTATPDTAANAMNVVVAQDTGNDVGNAIADIWLNDYLQGEASDADLLAKKAIAMEVLEIHMSVYRDAINARLSALSELLPHDVRMDEFVIIPSLNIASFVVGNPHFGSISEGEWTFNEKAAYLSGLINNGCGL